MRFVVIGAGAIGGVVGGRLAQAGYDVALVARGRHGEAIAQHGLRLEAPENVEDLHLPVAPTPQDLGLGPEDVVLVSVKSQDTAAALDAVYAAGGAEVPVVSLQNGVRNEQVALRLFREVYGVVVMCPAVHLTPGVVRVHSTPVTGLLDIGRYPEGSDDRATRISEAFEAATFRSQVREDVMAAKYGKLLLNLTNAIEVVCGTAARGGPLADMVRAEGEQVFAAAGITADVEADPRRDEMQVRPAAGQRWKGSSSMQSVLRGTGSVETDYLNGEIVLMGRIHGIPTPLNERIQWLAHQVAAGDRAPGETSPEEVFTATFGQSYAVGMPDSHE